MSKNNVTCYICMSKETETGGPAFPTETIHKIGSDGYIYEGMTMRDYFAAKAMQSLVAEQWAPKDCARQAYEFADAMLKARGA